MLDTYRHKGLRKNLVAGLKLKGITDSKVLAAIENVPRHFFLDSAFEEKAYEDKPFKIGEDQTISQPYTVAFQTQLLQIKKMDKVLEIGTGSGYQAAILAELGVNLYSIERHKSLYLKAKQVLEQLGYRAYLYCGDGTLGLPKSAPFDKIIVTAGAPVIPETLIEQLKPGGRMVIPVGTENRQKMLLITKDSNGQIQQKEEGDFLFVPLIGEKGWKK